MIALSKMEEINAYLHCRVFGELKVDKKTVAAKSGEKEKEEKVDLEKHKVHLYDFGLVFIYKVF